MHAAIDFKQSGSETVHIVYIAFKSCARASSEHKDDRALPLPADHSVWPLREELNALLMRPLNGKRIDQSVYKASNSIILQPKDREPNKHRRLTPQKRFFVATQHKVDNAFKKFDTSWKE